MDSNEDFRIRNKVQEQETKKNAKKNKNKNQCNYFVYIFFALKYRNKPQTVNYFGNFYKMSQYFASWLSRFGGKDFLLNQEIELQMKNE